jgi:hypothetical protein
MYFQKCTQLRKEILIGKLLVTANDENMYFTFSHDSMTYGGKRKLIKN